MGPPPGPVAARRVLGAVGFGAGLLAGWVWATGEVAGWLTTGRWVPITAGEMPTVLLRLPGHLRDPVGAWPSPVRADLPGPELMALTAAILAASTGAMMIGALRLRRFAGAGAGRGLGHGGGRAPRWLSRHRPTGAKWATGWDLRSLRVRRAAPGRLVVGRAGGHLIATEHRHSVLVVGPTQSGKTTGLAIPAILEWEGPVVATSVKDDLAQATWGWRATQGQCWVFDPTRTSGLAPLAGWSPLAEAGDWSGAQRAASWMVESTPAKGGMADGAFWFAAAAKLLAPLLLAARRQDGSMTDVVAWINAGDFDEPLATLERSGDYAASVALAACAARDERLRSSVGTTLETVLAPFEDPTVGSSTSTLDIEPDTLLAGSHTLYLCGPSHEQARVQGLFATLVSSVVAAAISRANHLGGPLDPPLLVVLDEAANVAPLRDLDTLASTGAGLGIQLVTVCQDLAQLATRYGPDRSRTIANNHRAKILLSGVSDLSTLDMLSGLAGEAAVRADTVTSDLRDGRRTRSTTTSYRRLAPTDELRRIRPGDGVLVYGHLPAARLQLRPWYRQRHLRDRATIRQSP